MVIAMTVVAYLAHALGEKNVAGFSTERSDNLANSIDWVKFLRLTTPWAICYPSFVYVAAVDDVFHHPRSLTDQIEILDRCDVYVPVGGVLNPHMKIEWRHAKNKSKPIVDLLYLGRYPPWNRKDVVAKEIEKLAVEADVWT
jgi:hypothetical protein